MPLFATSSHTPCHPAFFQLILLLHCFHSCRAEIQIQKLNVSERDFKRIHSCRPWSALLAGQYSWFCQHSDHQCTYSQLSSFMTHQSWKELLNSVETLDSTLIFEWVLKSRLTWNVIPQVIFSPLLLLTFIIDLKPQENYYSTICLTFTFWCLRGSHRV